MAKTEPEDAVASGRAEPLPGARSSVADDRPTGAWAVIKETVSRFRDDQMTDRAAALTYYSLMSLFPAMLIGVSLFGLLGEADTVDEIVDYLRDQGADESTLTSVREALRNGIAGGAVLTLVVGVATALYGAGGAFGATGRALNLVLRTEDDRPFVRHKLTDIACTLVLIVLSLVALILIFLGGGIAEDLFGVIGLGSTATTVWTIVRWPAAVAVAMVIYAFVYFAAPDDSERKFRWISPGAGLGVLIWIVASIGFFVYVANFGSYNKTYGAFATAVILLVWLWLTNVALLLGAELNAVLDSKESPRKDPVARGAETAREKLPPDGD